MATAVVIAENGVRLRVHLTGMIRMMKAVLAMSQSDLREKNPRPEEILISCSVELGNTEKWWWPPLSSSTAGVGVVVVVVVVVVVDACVLAIIENAGGLLNDGVGGEVVARAVGVVSGGICIVVGRTYLS